MFTGIIERLALLERLSWEGSNLHITFSSEITSEIKVDQSISHNGVCLTVVGISGRCYTVTAIKETLENTTIKSWQPKVFVNIERAMRLGDRLDGHIVQGHVDQIATCIDLRDNLGSKNFDFQYEQRSYRTVPKGSVTVNGVSLTVVDSKPQTFSVAIIPYTLEHTTFKTLKKGDTVNLEFDIIGKYLENLAKPYLTIA